MKVIFWGVRGSIATPGPSTVQFGGNTACIEVLSNNNQRIIFDAGTGIRELGNKILQEKSNQVNLLISHTHWDHIQGFPFFVPVFIPGKKITIYGPVHYEKKLVQIMETQMDYSYFPVRNTELASDISYIDLREEVLEIGDFTITTKYSNHTVTTLGFKVECDGKSLYYSGDMEPYYNPLSDHRVEEESILLDEQEDMELFAKESNQLHTKFCREVDLIIHDAQYTDEEYPQKRGWGHSTINQAIDYALEAKAKKLALFHHDPLRSDNQLLQLERQHQKNMLQKGHPLQLFFAREKQEIEL